MTIDEERATTSAATSEAASMIRADNHTDSMQKRKDTAILLVALAILIFGYAVVGFLFD